MKNFYSDPVGWGAYTPKRVESCKGAATQVDGVWMLARPEPYRSLFERIRQAWDVLTYNADALYWKEK